MTDMMRLIFIVCLWACLSLPLSRGFSPYSRQDLTLRRFHQISYRAAEYRTQVVLWNTESETEEGEKPKMSLEEKMKSWEASEEELKAASLGGVIPKSMVGKERTGAFDVGLYIAFPIMVITGLIFALFPLIMGSIDVDSVGPPPTV